VLHHGRDVVREEHGDRGAALTLHQRRGRQAEDARRLDDTEAPDRDRRIPLIRRLCGLVCATVASLQPSEPLKRANPTGNFGAWSTCGAHRARAASGASKGRTPECQQGGVPELPEVRALAERVGAALGGSSLGAVAVPGFSGLKTVAPRPQDLVGSTLERSTSRGKFLVLDFGAPGRALIHLGNSGRLDLEDPAKATRPRGSLVRFAFETRALLVREHGRERRAGLWVLGPGEEGPLETLGPEPFERSFAELVRHGADRRHLHTMLRDQHTVAGIGRGYADDVLHRARLSPFASLSGLDDDARERLLAGVLEVLSEALGRERQRTGGLSEPSLGDRFMIHRRAGTPCPRCGGLLERVSYSSNEIVYCPACQTQGKVLADRRLSRLLR